MFDLSEDKWKIISEVAQWLKYLFGGATTALSILSLRYETTVKADDPNQRKKLTGAGRWYQRGVLVLAAVTIVTTITSDVAATRLEKAAESRHQAELKSALDGQLNEGFKPILDKLASQVEDTSKQLNSSLAEQNKESTKKIVRQQESVQDSIKKSSLALDDLENDLELTAARTSSTLIEMQSSILEANRRVVDFHLGIAIAPGKQGSSTSYDWNVGRESLAANTKSACDNGDQAYCSFVAEVEHHWEATRTFAGKLYPGSGLRTSLFLELNGALLMFSVGDYLLLTSAAHTPSPYLGAITFSTVSHNNGVSIPHRIIHEPNQPEDVVSIRYDSKDNMLATTQVLARDLLLKVPLRLSVCADDVGPNRISLSEDQIRKATESLPKSITLTFEENLASEGPGGPSEQNRAGPVNPWVTHLYTLYRGKPEADKFHYCVNSNYIQ